MFTQKNSKRSVEKKRETTGKIFVLQTAPSKSKLDFFAQTYRADRQTMNQMNLTIHRHTSFEPVDINSRLMRSTEFLTNKIASKKLAKIPEEDQKYLNSSKTTDSKTTEISNQIPNSQNERLPQTIPNSITQNKRLLHQSLIRIKTITTCQNPDFSTR